MLYLVTQKTIKLIYNTLILFFGDNLNSLEGHWKLQEGILKKVYIKEFEDFIANKTISVLKIKNNKLLPKWAKSESKIFIPGYSAKYKEDADVLLKLNDVEVSLLDINESIYLNNFNRIIDSLLFEDYFKKKRPIFSKLPIPYYLIPFRHILFRKFFYLGKKDTKFPDWPTDVSVELLRNLYINAIKQKLGKKIPYIGFWPKGRFAVCLTHDSDSKSSFKNIDKIREIEKRYGFNSSWNVLSKRYKMDYKKLKQLVNDGCEIGIHGYTHDASLAFLPRKEIERRINYSISKLNRFEVEGFRSPQLKRNRRFLNLLANYFLYDSSVPNSEYKSSLALRTGSCSVFPFFIRNMVEIPLTMPQDFTLIYTMKFSKNKILKIWKEKIDLIRQMNGLVCFNTHPDDYLIGNDKYLDIYEEILKYLSKQDSWNALPREIAEWWKERFSCELKGKKIIGSDRAKIWYI